MSKAIGRETHLVHAVVALIHYRGGKALRINSGASRIPGEGGAKDRIVRWAPVGTSDVIACYRGRYLAIECKVGDNTTTRHQDLFLEEIRQAGGMTLVAYCLEDVEALLHSIDQAGSG